MVEQPSRDYPEAMAPQFQKWFRDHRAFAQGVVGEMVGGADGLHEGLADVGIEIGALPENHALPAVLLDDLFEPVAYVSKGLVPGGLFPFPGGPGPRCGSWGIGAARGCGAGPGARSLWRTGPLRCLARGGCLRSTSRRHFPPGPGWDSAPCT